MSTGTKHAVRALLQTPLSLSKRMDLYYPIEMSLIPFMNSKDSFMRNILTNH